MNTQAPAPPNVAPTPLVGNRAFLANVWGLVRPYWVSEERWLARVLLAAVVGLNLGMVAVNVLFNQWYARFYNALEQKNSQVFWHEMWVFCGLAAVYIFMGVYALYLNQMLQIRWRRWLTEVYFANWLRDQVYYRLELTSRGTDNPDQRIAEDLAMFAQAFLSLSLGLMRSVVTLFSFLGVLWFLSGPLAIPFLGITIPGYMVWVAIIYAAVGSGFTHWIGKPLIPLNFNQQRYEADFRFGLVRLRENAEGVALYGGEAGEREHLRGRFGHVWRNWWLLMKFRKRLTWFTTGYAQAVVIFPFLVAGPRYFSGQITLGGLIQISNTFGQVQDSLSWFVTAYPSLVEWKASTDRLITFDQAMARAAAESTREPAIRVRHDSRDGLGLEGLTLRTPDGTPLLEDTSLSIPAGGRVLVTGPSGAGKSTLFRALSGIWPYGEGTVRLPADARSLFLPQKPYMPIGELREAVSYPSPPGAFADAEIAAALRDTGLEALTGALGESDHWARRLSPGEQQRLAVARALLQRPNYLFLDEATSALDEATERHLYALLRERLPDITLVSIAHRPTLEPFHGTRWVLGGAAPARSLRVEPLAAAASGPR